MTRSGQLGTFETSSADETLAFGEALGRSLVGGLTIALTGPLGAGKTQLVKGIASGNAVGDVRQVTSPTFTLVHEYPGRLRLLHVDVYRLGAPSELIELGYEEFAGPDTVVVVEWADRARSAISEQALWIELALTGRETRRLSVHATGEAAARCLHGLSERFG